MVGGRVGEEGRRGLWLRVGFDSFFAASGADGASSAVFSSVVNVDVGNGDDGRESG